MEIDEEQIRPVLGWVEDMGDIDVEPTIAVHVHHLYPVSTEGLETRESRGPRYIREFDFRESRYGRSDQSHADEKQYTTSSVTTQYSQRSLLNR